MWISTIEICTLLCCVFYISDFHWLLFFFSFFLFISPLLSFVFQGQSMESLHWPFAWQIIMMRRKQIRQKERDDSFDVRESEREEQWISLWCLDETFQNSKWESASVIHSDILCRHLQSMQDQKARRKLLTWLTISRFKIVSLNLKLLINIFPGLSSKFFLLQFDKFPHFQISRKSRSQMLSKWSQISSLDNLFLYKRWKILPFICCINIYEHFCFDVNFDCFANLCLPTDCMVTIFSLHSAQSILHWMLCFCFSASRHWVSSWPRYWSM